MGFTADSLPILGHLPRDSRILFAVGLNGHGLSLGAAVAERIVDYLINQNTLGLFNVQRLL